MTTFPIHKPDHTDANRLREKALKQSKQELHEILGKDPNPGFLRAVADQLPSNVLGFRLLAEATQVPNHRIAKLTSATESKLRQIRLRMNHNPNPIRQIRNWQPQNNF